MGRRPNQEPGKEKGTEVRTGKESSGSEGTEPANQACRQAELGERMQYPVFLGMKTKEKVHCDLIPPTGQAVSFPEHLLSWFNLSCHSLGRPVNTTSAYTFLTKHPIVQCFQVVTKSSKLCQWGLHLHSFFEYVPASWLRFPPSSFVYKYRGEPVSCACDSQTSGKQESRCWKAPLHCFLSRFVSAFSVLILLVSVQTLASTDLLCHGRSRILHVTLIWCKSTSVAEFLTPSPGPMWLLKRHWGWGSLFWSLVAGTGLWPPSLCHNPGPWAVLA